MNLEEKDEVKHNEALARAACIIGGVFDALMLLPMLFPSLGGKLFGLRESFPGSDYHYAMSVAASLMLGWTLLLFWASRRPVQRAAVLMLTAIVVACLMLAGGHAVLSGFIPLRKLFTDFAAQVCHGASLATAANVKKSNSAFAAVRRPPAASSA